MPSLSVFTAAFDGERMVRVQIETDRQPGLPSFNLLGVRGAFAVGLDARLRAALRNASFSWPRGRITVTVSPAVIEQGSGLECAIAYSLMRLDKQVPLLPEETLLCGTLGLDGSIRSFAQAGLLFDQASYQHWRVAGPTDQEGLARKVGGFCFLGLSSLAQMRDRMEWEDLALQQPDCAAVSSDFLIDRLSGLSVAKRAICVAMAGRHNLSLLGPAGVGKTKLVQAAAQLLPPLNREVRSCLIVMQAAAGQFAVSYPVRRPFRAPHHASSPHDIFGSRARPGEYSLAHGGLLFLDEFTLLSKRVREGLREPLAAGYTEQRLQGKLRRYPGPAMVWAAANGCFCGRRGAGGICRCTPGELVRYAGFFNEALAERFHMHVWIEKGDASKPDSPDLQGKKLQETIVRCWYEGERPQSLESQKLIQKARETLNLSPRAVETLHQISETIAKVEGWDEVTPVCVTEALQYRFRYAI